MSDLYPLAQRAYQQWEGGEETGLRALELFRFKKLTEATSGTAIEHDKYRYIKCRNACGSPTGDADAAQRRCSVTTAEGLAESVASMP